MAIIKDEMTVGHVPRRISSVCSLFLRKSGARIVCKITGNRHYSKDLPQGGLELPCIYIFSGNSEGLVKVSKLLSSMKYPYTFKSECIASEVTEPEQIIVEPEKMELEQEPEMPITIHENGIDTSPQLKRRKCDTIWLKINDTWILTEYDYDLLSGGLELNDNLVNAAQQLLSRQFPSTNFTRFTSNSANCNPMIGTRV